ncbi:hypothetical protein V8G54_017112 [Vigna mungo]|uniref:Uncharacterized protein n=1 Tax=Vigna mungo TaxID=3915 RepID=A0AAQ3NNW8_VIGMU
MEITLIYGVTDEKKEGKKPISGDKGNNSQSKDFPLNFHQYTPLNAPRTRILEKALSAYILMPVKKNSIPRNVDGKRHCQYHQNLGHTTSEVHAGGSKLLIQYANWTTMSKPFGAIVTTPHLDIKSLGLAKKEGQVTNVDNSLSQKHEKGR